jgi:aspartate ammonia-lyase
MRTEEDFIGKVRLPDDSLTGIATKRALDNFGHGPDRTDPALSRAFLLVKKACALTNAELGYLQKEKCGLIVSAAEQLLAGDPEGLWMTVNPLSGGAGTSLNMCVNEVLANTALRIAGRPAGDYGFLHPLRDVNMHQSTNDVFPTALKTAALFLLSELEQTLLKLQATIQTKENEFSGVVRLGRTELQDALPVTAGMQFSAWADAVGRDRWRVFKCGERIRTVNLGGTALGTGFNAPREYIFRVTDVLRDLTGLPLSRSENLMDATQNMDAAAEISGNLRVTAVDLMKISEDLRLASSGPDGGIGELILPALQEGSSIMPGKVNPVIPEFVIQNSLLVISQDQCLSTACGLGNFELNQYLPLIAWCLLRNIRLLNDSADRLDRLCLTGLRLNLTKIEEHLGASLGLLTFLAPRIGHETAGRIYKLRQETGKDIATLLLEQGILSADELRRLTSADAVASTGFSGGKGTKA